MNDFYKSVSAAHKKGLPAAAPIYEELKKRYEEQGKRKTKAVAHPTV